MPVQFTGIGREHAAVRTAAGMFDISHMGKFVLYQGRDDAGEQRGVMIVNAATTSKDKAWLDDVLFADE